MTATKRPDGSFHIVEKEMTPERLDHLRNTGRGRLLHPKSELEAVGHPSWDEANIRLIPKPFTEGTQPSWRCVT
ncbi:MAG: hypothetical protein R3C02_17940 [Planctomycetaceae bacterium]